jgi:hypothetical protein
LTKSSLFLFYFHCRRLAWGACSSYPLLYKVFKYITLHVYGNHYEGGGFLFYTLTSILFYMCYTAVDHHCGWVSIDADIFPCCCSLLQSFTFLSIAPLWSHREHCLWPRRVSWTRVMTHGQQKKRKFDANRKAKAIFEEMEQEDGSRTDIPTRKVLPGSDVDQTRKSHPATVSLTRTDGE